MVRDMSIKKFLHTPVSKLFDNCQTRYLLKGLAAPCTNKVDDALLPLVQRTLLTLPFFGITNRYNESVELLQGVMGKKGKMRVSRDNKSRNRPGNYSLTSSEQEKLEQRLHQDIELFRFAENAFTARLKALRANV